MLCTWVISFVHSDSFYIVIDGNVNAMPGCHLNPCACPTAAGEIINYKLAVYHT
jgi:hypothetical protein